LPMMITPVCSESNKRKNVVQRCIKNNKHVNKTYKQVRMYYGSGTGGRCCICARQMLRVHLSNGSTFLREMTSRSGVTSCQKLVDVYIFLDELLRNFIPIRFETTELSAFLKRSPQQEEEQKEQKQDK